MGREGTAVGRGGKRTAALLCGALLAGAPAAGQGIRTVGEGAEAAPIEVATRVRHTTTIVLPPGESVVDVAAGDAEYWDVSAAGNVAYVKPLDEGLSSNVTLVAGSGAVWALLVEESADAEPDLVVHVGARERRAAERREAPAFVAGAALAAEEREEAAARAERRAVEEAAAAEVAAIWAGQDAEWRRWREEYPRRLRFPYRLDPAAAEAPFRVEALWHDGRFTYLRSGAQESPALYELHETGRGLGGGLEPALVAYDVREDGLYVADHVLGPGRLRIGAAQTEWAVGKAAGRWPWPVRALAGGMLGAAAFLLLKPGAGR
ncbi:MAG: TrbG/VirB9 family P-type conjugative transfer protein [Acidobacteria bacterium]|nr:TrbG/VirB9 family P-type conjugative transfer protein [Acidobacteriota bacterium]